MCSFVLCCHKTTTKKTTDTSGQRQQLTCNFHLFLSRTNKIKQVYNMDEQEDVQMGDVTLDDPQRQQQPATGTNSSSGDDAAGVSNDGEPSYEPSAKRKREEPSTVSVPSSGTREGEINAERSDLSSSDSNKKNGQGSSNGEQSSGDGSPSDEKGQRTHPANDIERVWLALLRERPSKVDKDKMKLWIECVLLTSEYMAPSTPSDEQDSSNKSGSSGSNSGSNSGGSGSKSAGSISNDEISELLVNDAMNSLESIHRVMLRGVPRSATAPTGQISSATTNSNSSNEKNSSSSRSSNEDEDMKQAPTDAAAKKPAEVTSTEEEGPLDDGRIFPRSNLAKKEDPNQDS